MATTVYAALQAGIRIKAPKPGKSGPKRIGLTQDEEDAKKRRLRTVCPSEGWVEAHFTRSVDHDPDGKPLIYTLFDRKAFPPPADAAPMCRCRKCQRQAKKFMRLLETGSQHSLKQSHRLEKRGLAPHPGQEQLLPPDVHAGEVICVDHISLKYNRAFGDSPSAKAIRELQHRNLRLEDVKLESERTSDLKREIAMYEQGRSPLAKRRISKGRSL